jgi:glutamyl-tRNA synthetase
MSEVVTRFAPSPTGFLHIGGARTALFNWLYARHCGGKFLIRIEDTDKKRSTDEAVAAILDGLDWIGLAPDEPPVFQSELAARHLEIADQMVNSGGAYPCFLTEDELASEKDKARAEKRTFQSPWRDCPADRLPQDRPFVIRLKTPLDGETRFEDQVQGSIEFKNENMDDLILVRADRTPTYMLAVVVDDHEMGITHVIRGDDHLVNAARQILIYAAAGWKAPVFAHIPLIHGPDGKKLSKRHGALGVSAYRDMGYLPEALMNYLLRLGWSHGDQEFFTPEEAAAVFTLQGVNRGPSRLDFEKMAHVNNHYLQQAKPARLAQLVADHMRAETGISLSSSEIRHITPAMPVLAPKAKIIPDLVPLTAFLLQKRPLEINPKARKMLTEERLAYLAKLKEGLKSLSNWHVDEIAKVLHDFAEENQIGFGKFGPGLRAAISGGLPAPDLAAACALLGQEETIGRIDDLPDLPLP